MNTDRDDRSPKPEERGISSVRVLLGRLMWFIIGPAILIFTTYGIVSGSRGWLAGANATYLVTVALMVLGRWVEQRSGVATTATGEPATWDHYRKYVRVLIPLAIVIWIVANVLGNHILKATA